MAGCLFGGGMPNLIEGWVFNVGMKIFWQPFSVFLFFFLKLICLRGQITKD